MAANPKVLQFKLVLLGESAVGKSRYAFFSQKKIFLERKKTL
jgi:hypothetical protein